MATPEDNLTSDFLDPAEEDWREADLAELYHASKAGIPQATAELRRREQGASGLRDALRPPAR
jgi:hypothetical protein